MIFRVDQIVWYICHYVYSAAFFACHALSITNGTFTHNQTSYTWLFSCKFSCKYFIYFTWYFWKNAHVALYSFAFIGVTPHSEFFLYHSWLIFSRLCPFAPPSPRQMVAQLVVKLHFFKVCFKYKHQTHSSLFYSEVFLKLGPSYICKRRDETLFRSKNMLVPVYFRQSCSHAFFWQTSLSCFLLQQVMTWCNSFVIVLSIWHFHRVIK